VTVIWEIGSKISIKICRLKTWNIGTQFWTTSWLDGEQLRKETRYRQSEKCIENCKHSGKWRYNPTTTNKKVIDRSFDRDYIYFSNDRISGAKGLCSLKILSLLQGDDSLLTLCSSGTPPREWYSKKLSPGGNVMGRIATSSCYSFSSCGNSSIFKSQDQHDKRHRVVLFVQTSIIFQTFSLK